jgi:methionyl-tRNA formyltransferase
MSIRVVFLGNSASTFTARHFRALLETPAELIAAVDVPPASRQTTNPLPADLPNFVDVARQRSIPVFEPSNPNDPAFIAALRDLCPDLFLAVGYALILKEEILGVPQLLAVNFHASLLPSYRGKHPVFWTLRGGEKWSGLTVHAMDRGIDTGDILYQVKVRTRRDDTVASLYDRIMDQSVKLVGRLVGDATHETVPRCPQPEGEGSYYSSTSEADFRINWSWPAEKIRRYITATPGQCFAEIGERRVYFHNAEVESATKTMPPGTLLRVGRTRAAVAAGQGVVTSTRIQVKNGELESFAAFCRRRGLIPGDVLTT